MILKLKLRREEEEKNDLVNRYLGRWSLLHGLKSSCKVERRVGRGLGARTLFLNELRRLVSIGGREGSGIKRVRVYAYVPLLHLSLGVG